MHANFARVRTAPAAAALVFAAVAALVFGVTSASAVVGGKPVDARSFPWLAAVGSPLLVIRPAGQFCGGVLIAPDRVLTAAHCVALLRGVPQSLTVTLGRSDLRDSDGQRVGVRRVRIHPGFHETEFRDTTVEHGDLAVLELRVPQNRPTLAIAPVHGTSGVVAGWGGTADGDYFSNTRLQMATVPLVPDTTCAAAYGSAFDPRDMICAGSPEADTGQFDSGGPLIVDGKLVGLTSWAFGTARPGFPGVYTRLSTLFPGA